VSTPALGNPRPWIPDWLVESRQLSGLSCNELGMLVARQQQANQSLAPYIGLAILILSPFLLLLDIERAESGLFAFGLTGRSYLIAAVCHGILALSAVPALALKHRSLAANSPLAARVLRLHLNSFFLGLLALSSIAVLTHGAVFMRAACLLIVTNFLYIVHWRLRAAVNAASLASGTALIFTLAPLTGIQRMVTFVDLLTLVLLCVIGGAIVHRDRTAGYLAQYRESLHLARLCDEIHVASKLQQSLLPTPWPATPAFSVEGMMRPRTLAVTSTITSMSTTMPCVSSWRMSVAKAFPPDCSACRPRASCTRQRCSQPTPQPATTSARWSHTPTTCCTRATPNSCL
jgi:hypothetical protein